MGVFQVIKLEQIEKSVVEVKPDAVFDQTTLCTEFLSQLAPIVMRQGVELKAIQLPNGTIEIGAVRKGIKRTRRSRKVPLLG